MATLADTLNEAIKDSINQVDIRVKPQQPATAVGAAPSGPTSLGGASSVQALSNPQLPSLQTSASSGAAASSPQGGIGGLAPDLQGQQAALANAQFNVGGRTNAPLQLDTSAPLGAQTDSIYEAAVAQLSQAAQQQYMDYLQQLGYVDQSSGQLIPGTLETEAIRQRYELNRQLEEAMRTVDENASRGGTVFSGRRVQQQGLATDPLRQRMGNLETDLARAISEALRGVGNIQAQYGVDRNLLIAEAAERARQRALQQSAMAPAPPSGGAPPPPPSTPPAPPPMPTPVAPPPPPGIDLSWLDPAIRAAMQARGTGMYV